MSLPSSLVIFTSLPEVGGHTTTTLKLCEILAPSFSSISVIVKEIPGHGHSPAAEESLRQLGVQTVPCKHPLALAREFHRPHTFLCVGMRHLSPILALLLRPQQSIYYHITHELSGEMRRQLAIYRFFFSKILFLSPATFHLFGSARRTDWAVQPTELPRRISSPKASSQRVARLGLIGRLNAAKGTDLLLDFMASTTTPCELHVAGSGECEPRIRAMADDSSRPGRVVFHGSFQPDQRVEFLQSFFANVDTLCVPSLDDREGIPNVILESLQAGIPVLASRTGGMRSFESQEFGPAPTGTITLAEPDQLPAAFASLVLQPPPNLAKACQTYFHDHFSDDVVKKRWLKILNLRS